MSRPLVAKRAAKLRRLLKVTAKAGKFYSQKHALTAELIKITPVGVEIEGPDGKKYAVKDNFAGRTAFKTCAIDRFEVKPVDDRKAPR